MSAHCGNCNNTGSLSKTFEGYLDCPYCKAAEVRASLNALGKTMPEHEETKWFLFYLLGFEEGQKCKV